MFAARKTIPGSRCKPNLRGRPYVAFSVVAKHSIKPYIPSIWRYFLDSLALERYANQFGTQPVFPVPEVGKAAIEVSSAHADPVVIVVEGHCRRNGNVEFSR